jgi:hypothetical protein
LAVPDSPEAPFPIPRERLFLFPRVDSDALKGDPSLGH